MQLTVSTGNPVVSQFEILLAGQLENVQSDSPSGTGGVARRAGVVVKSK